LHDIGIVFFLDHFPEEYRQALKKQKAGVSLVDAEREIFEMDHSEAGCHLATTWHIPDQIISAIANHHNNNPSSADDILVNITRLAGLLTFDRFSDDEQKLEDRVIKIGELSERLTLNMDHIGQITEDLTRRIIDMAQTFGVEIGQPDKLLTTANREIWKSYLTIEQLFKERNKLDENLLAQERQKGAAEAKNTALSTLSHYVNNATAVISGQFQIMRMLQNQGETEKIMDRLPVSAEIAEKAISKIGAVMRVMREISPTDDIEFFNMSKAMNIDDRIADCMEEMANEPAVVLPIDD